MFTLNQKKLSLTCNKNKKIVINDIYRLIGYPLDEEKVIIIETLFDNKQSLEDSLNKINKAKIELSLSTIDIIKEIVNNIITNIDKFNKNLLEDLLICLSEYEIRLQGNTSDYIQLIGLVSDIKYLYN